MKIDDLLLPPGRKHRPPQIVVILRGLPGSGKTYVGKLIKVKDKLLWYCGTASTIFVVRLSVSDA